MHLITPHLPIVSDADAGTHLSPSRTPGDFRNQARCALSAVRALLSRLRELDLYDRSAIVVTSDHGTNLSLIPTQGGHLLHERQTPAGTLDSIVSYATPLLLVKPFAAEGPLQISHAPTSIVDVPATLLDLADVPGTLGRGTSVLGIDPVVSRQRTYTHSDWQWKRILTTMSSTFFRSTDRSPTRTPGTINERYSGQRMIARRSAESNGSACFVSFGPLSLDS